MKKINSSNKIFIKILLTTVLLNIIFVAIFSMLSSLVIYKLDLNLEYSTYFTYLISAMTSLIVPFISLYSLKSNGFLMGILCSLPLVTYIIVNSIIYSHKLLETVIKLALIIAFSGISGILKVRKNRKFKVK